MITSIYRYFSDKVGTTIAVGDQIRLAKGVSHVCPYINGVHPEIRTDCFCLPKPTSRQHAYLRGDRREGQELQEPAQQGGVPRVLRLLQAGHRRRLQHRGAGGRGEEGPLQRLEEQGRPDRR